MSNSIGQNILELRKEKGSTQEELANAVKISAQAVSKWENNASSPDTELLPAIADFFGVSIDRLFSRTLGEYSDINVEVVKFLQSYEPNERMMAAYKLCWAMQNGTVPTAREYSKLEPNEHRCHSDVLTKECSALMAKHHGPLYYFITPQFKNDLLKMLPAAEEYGELFRLLADVDTLRALIFLHGRKNDKPFTPNLLVKELGVSAEKATGMLTELTEMHFILEQKVELDDEVIATYNFRKSERFIGLLIFASEILKLPNRYHLGYFGGDESYWYVGDDE